MLSYVTSESMALLNEHAFFNTRFITLKLSENNERACIVRCGHLQHTTCGTNGDSGVLCPVQEIKEFSVYK